MLKRLITQSDNHLDQEQCQQIHQLSPLHRKANEVKRNSNFTKNVRNHKEELRNLNCHCDCQRVAGQSYPICHDILELSFMGSGILFFFYLLKGLFVSSDFMVVIYSFDPIAKNYQGEKYLAVSPSNTCNSSYCHFKDRVSRFNLTDVNYVTDVLNLMGLASMIFWILVCRFLKYYCFKKDELIYQNLDFGRLSSQNRQSSQRRLQLYYQPLNLKNKGNLYSTPAKFTFDTPTNYSLNRAEDSNSCKQKTEKEILSAARWAFAQTSTRSTSPRVNEIVTIM